MGSLSSSAKAPQQSSPQVVYTAQPSATSKTVSAATAAEPSAEEQASEARKKTLLRRNRGRFGTIATGLQGFLSERLNNDRKTLLGE